MKILLKIFLAPFAIITLLCLAACAILNEDFEWSKE